MDYAKTLIKAFTIGINQMYGRKVFNVTSNQEMIIIRNVYNICLLYSEFIDGNLPYT